MLVMLGLILLATGVGLILLGRPRGGGQEMRPMIARSALMQAAYPAFCLGFLTFGAAVVLTAMLNAS